VRDAAIRWYKGHLLQRQSLSIQHRIRIMLACTHTHRQTSVATCARPLLRVPQHSEADDGQKKIYCIYVDTLNAAGLLECSHAYCVIVLYPLPVSRFPHSFEDSSSEVPRRELGGVGVEMDANFLQGRAGQVMVHRAR
jgi:hypothetical protein